MRSLNRVILGGFLVAQVARAGDDPLASADEAYGAARYQQAHDLALKVALASDEPGLSSPARSKGARAWRLAGASSCFLKDRPGSLTALAHLTKEDIEFVRFACKRQAIEFTDDEIHIAASPARPEMQEAQAAYDAAKYPLAKKLALAATVADPKLSVAWRLLGAASCWTKDKTTAQRACEHLQPVDQEFIRSTCARTLGVKLQNPRVLR
ncbi:MAG: hypothetical protein EXR72_01875 [Myxococcales bacterium]|nr:hypothetical protein [Myxococcales bacterium]